jgi:DNA polymerase III alpha subunit (gram-positive type)
MTFTDCMVDIETGGLSPDKHPMLQLAAVKFNLLTGEVDDTYFDRWLVTPETRSWDPDTRHWWSKMPDILSRIEARAEPIEPVLIDFQEFVCKEGPSIRFWAKPLSFDYPFVQSYFREAGLAMPFHYRLARDMNTYMAAIKDRGGYADHNDVDVPFVGPQHNALFDVIHQIKVLLQSRKNEGL